MSSTGRKRQRQPIANMPELPDVPNVPMDVIPYLVQALKTTTKAFQMQAKLLPQQPYTLQYLNVKAAHTSLRSQFNPTIREDSSHEEIAWKSWMERVKESQEKEEKDSPMIAELQERKLTMDRAVGAWIESVQRFARPKTDTPKEGPTEKEARISVPYASFLYLWGIQLEHSRPVVRRAALLLSSLLLQRSQDCRFHYHEHLLDWMTSLSKTSKLPHSALIIQEAFHLTNHLLDQGYGSKYPKLRVASRRLRQLCPKGTVIDQRQSQDWRQVRNIALQYGRQELNKVDRLLLRSQSCLMILVPRMGYEETQPSSTLISNDDDDDSEDIEWEDGDNFVDGAQEPADHASAVERTLVAMETMGGLKGGGIEIDFENPTTAVEATPTDENDKALTRLKSCVHRLGKRHLPRLSAWINGLTNADNLDLKDSTLISLSSDQVQLRRYLIEELTQRKQKVASVLASAARLQLKEGETSETTTHSTEDSERRPIAPRLCGDGGRPSLMRSVCRTNQRKRHRSTRSNRVQIKCRKTG